MSDLTSLVTLRSEVTADPDFPDDALALACCDLALAALDRHNYGVGAIIVHNDGEVLAAAENAVFGPRMDSAGHAEMRALNQFEREAPCPPREAELFVLLEPCPMCTARALYAGLRSVRWVVNDRAGGMLHKVRSLPPAWRNLAELQYHSRARVSVGVYALCEKVALANLPALRQQWRRLMGISP